MEKDKHKTKVKFVNLEGEVLALFPEQRENKYQIMSYLHIGQHGLASDSYLRRKSVPLKKYASLKKELESLGYNLEVIE